MALEVGLFVTHHPIILYTTYNTMYTTYICINRLIYVMLCDTCHRLYTMYYYSKLYIPRAGAALGSCRLPKMVLAGVSGLKEDLQKVPGKKLNRTCGVVGPENWSPTNIGSIPKAPGK